MSRIRLLKIQNFRCIKSFTWLPGEGINCFVGPGDSGKSTILDAIDMCLGARRSLQFTDADFHKLNVEEPISITITVGELDDRLKNAEAYGDYLRGFDAVLGIVEDEPRHDAETVLTLSLTVSSDLEPTWKLVSDRAEAQGKSRYLSWADRVRLAPTRIGAHAENNLAWRKGSVLNRLTDEEADTSAALASAAREVRKQFGEQFGELAEEQLGKTLAIVSETASKLGIPVGDDLTAMLDAQSVSFSGGTISLHGEDGVPVRNLGLGSIRLLVAGLQRKASAESTMVLIDELEHGLEPHRIIRFLNSIGSKDSNPPLQAFVTTHSPVVLKELSGDQLFVLRKMPTEHRALLVGTADDVQGTIRTCPDAFLARSVIVCEGASEVGLLRGIDQSRAAKGRITMGALGVALVDAGGCSKIYGRVNALKKLGYRTAVFRDDDVHPNAADETAYIADGGTVFKWGEGKALEEELFAAVADEQVQELLEMAIRNRGEELVADHIQSETVGAISLADCRAGVTEDTRLFLGRAAKNNSNSWFKKISWMEEVARDILGPNFQDCEKEFCAVIVNLRRWILNAGHRN